MPYFVLQVTRPVIILILDANDNIPVFNQSSYDVTIPEVSPLLVLHSWYAVFCQNFELTESKSENKQ